MTEIYSGKIALVFPGGGSQYVGMGRDLYETSPAARRVFETADRVLGFGITALCFEGPEPTLTDAHNSQPAMLTTSIACLAALEEKLGQSGKCLTPAFVAGHSQGEYSALVAAGSLAFEDALCLVRKRGWLMRCAGEVYPGGMAAVMGLDDAALEQVCREASTKGMICIANYNCPGQLVISGEEEALKEAMSLATSRGAKRVVRLAVTIGSHSPLMRPATVDFAKAVMEANIADARIPVIANLSARPITRAAEIKQELADQLCNSVLWAQSVQHMIDAGVDTFLEIGPGNTLTGLIRRISRDVKVQNLGDRKSIDAFVASYSQADEQSAA